MFRFEVRPLVAGSARLRVEVDAAGERLHAEQACLGLKDLHRKITFTAQAGKGTRGIGDVPVTVAIAWT